MPVEIDFSRIRPHGGSRDRAFEELCCQLAGLEPMPPGAVFYRKGPGGDAGVECFVVRPDGSEVGWQAKYFSQFGQTQVDQLEKSIGAALAKHPHLDTYIVCLPIDLRDNRTGRRMTELERWRRWAERRTAACAEQGRCLHVQLWSKSNLIERLTRDEPLYAGRLTYWFDATVLTPEWFKRRFTAAKAALGARYTPETGVDLPIRKCLLGFARDPALAAELDELWALVEKRRHEALAGLRCLPEAAGIQIVPDLDTATAALADAISACARTMPDRDLSLANWQAACGAGVTASQAALRWLLDLPSTEQDAADRRGSHDRRGWARHVLVQLVSTVHDCRDLCYEDRLCLANYRLLLLHGAPGAGKSHLFADAVDHQVEHGRPALLLLGGTFVEGEPWRQVLDQLDLGGLFVRRFLGALDAAAEAVGTRAVIFVDAINERHGMDLWPARLAAFLAEVEAYPRVAVAVSCRTTYLPAFDAAVPEHAVPRLEHHGFAGTGGEAARRYLGLRGIVRPGAPAFSPEFDNPLFLRTCCDLLERTGRRDFPRGLQGVTAVFGFYVDAVTSAIERRMGLEARQRIPRRVLDALTEALPHTGALPYEQAFAIAEDVLPSGGRADRSLLTQLEHEGIIAVEPAKRGADEVVRFTFERLGDHRVAERLLARHLELSDVAGSFAPGTPLGEVVSGHRAERTAGVVEALAVQLPERTGVEILDAVGWPESENHVAERAFLESLLWREQGRFTRRTLDLLAAVSEDRGEDLVLPALLALATEPANAFNARHLDGKLRGWAMPDRDARWSVPIARLAEDAANPLDTLVSWAGQDGFGAIEDERAELAATVLAWTFATPHRALRDRATKALAALLATRPGLAARLVRSFAGVDDPYVVERVLAATYGAALQALAPTGLGELAAEVHRLFFATGHPIPHLLARDYARGMVELAAHRGELPAGLEVSAARPPYRSGWPIEAVPQEEIEAYKEERNGHVFRDEIVGSAVNDGDFARYVVDGRVGHWGCSELGEAPPATHLDRCRTWRETFDAFATQEQQAALHDLETRAAELDAADDEKDGACEAVDVAEQRFLALLPPAEREDYRVRARVLVRGGPGLLEHHAGRAARFDTGWARRWVCRRAHDLGWTAERFSGFEHGWLRSGGRTDHRIERVGKKYQWIALHELLARLADNAVFFADSWAGRPGAYEGPWQVSSRDLDPSMLLPSTPNDGWKRHPRTWWVPMSPKLRPLTPEERLVWLDGPQDLLNDPSLIEVTDLDGQGWLVLDAFAMWQQRTMRDGHERFEQDTWFRLGCLVVEKSDEDGLVAAITGKSLTDAAGLPSYERLRNVFLGEHPWHPAADGGGDWVSPSDWPGIPVPVRRPTIEYFAERGGYDYSLEESVRFEMPAGWLMRALDLHLVDGRQPRYVDRAGRTLFFDPSAFSPGPDAAVVDRAAFTAMLEREGLAAVWVIAGEKGAYGGKGPSASGMAFGGRQVHTSIYRMHAGTLSRVDHTFQERPSAEQLAEFLGRPSSKCRSGRPAEAKLPEIGKKKKSREGAPRPTVRAGRSNPKKKGK